MAMFQSFKMQKSNIEIEDDKSKFTFICVPLSLYLSVFVSIFREGSSDDIKK
jgi:hypothetical protein